MESILSVTDEVYPLKSRHKKNLLSSTHISNKNSMKKRNILSTFYQYIKRIIAQQSLYIIGVLNLALAGVAIVCVAQAEDHPEYFSLVYISVSIFLFYMATIIFIIILQIIETYHGHHKKHRLSLSIEIPLSKAKLPIQSNPMIVQSMIATTQPKTRLSRSQTLPLTLDSLNPLRSLSTSTSSSTLKDFNQITSTRLALLPKYHQSNINLPKNYQSFALTTYEHFCPSCTTMTNSNSNPQLSPLIKPIPLKKSKSKFSHY